MSVGALAKLLKQGKTNITKGDVNNFLGQLDDFVKSENKRGVLPKVNQDYYDTFDPKTYYHATTQDINKFNPFEDPIYGAYSREGGVDSRGATYFTSNPFMANQVLKARRNNELDDIRDQIEEVYNDKDMQDFMKQNYVFKDAIEKNPKLYKNDPFQLYDDAIDELLFDAELPASVSKRSYTQGSQIYPVKIKTKDVFDYDNNDHIDKLENKILAQFSDESEEFDRLSRVKSGDWLALEEPYVQDALQNLGFSGYKTNEPGTVGLFNPDKGDVRSLYAKFDPKEAKSGEILASIVPYASVGTIGALAGLDEST
jgi:hypothetical protein